jgi:hypothetical protein
MADDFKARAAEQRLKVLSAAKSQVAANIALYESNGDLDSAADELQAYANLETEENNLVSSYQRHVARNAPRDPGPISDTEFMAMSPERMLQHPETVDRIFSKSKYYSKDQWGDPEVAGRVRAGMAAVEQRKREGR